MWQLGEQKKSFGIFCIPDFFFVHFGLTQQAGLDNLSQVNLDHHF